jgi:hypothetical protein
MSNMRWGREIRSIEVMIKSPEIAHSVFLPNLKFVDSRLSIFKPPRHVLDGNKILTAGVRLENETKFN